MSALGSNFFNLNNKLVNHAEGGCSIFNVFLQNDFVEETWNRFDNDFNISSNFWSWEELAISFKACYKLYFVV